MLSSYSE